VQLANPTAHSLSHKISVGGCGQPRSWRMRLSTSAIFAAANRPAYFVSWMAEHTTGMGLEWQDICTLMKVKGSRSRERVQGSEKTR
jgi:hypothetical protein